MVVLIIFPFILQTDINFRMLSIEGQATAIRLTNNVLLPLSEGLVIHWQTLLTVVHGIESRCNDPGAHRTNCSLACFRHVCDVMPFTDILSPEQTALQMTLVATRTVISASAPFLAISTHYYATNLDLITTSIDPNWTASLTKYAACICSIVSAALHSFFPCIRTQNLIFVLL